MTREGGCFCGAVRYRYTGEPLTLYACHCTDCQTRTGSAFALQLVIVQDDLTLIQGQPDREGEVGERVRCAACGTSLWRERRKTKGAVWLRAGTLDDTRWLKPIAHIWTRSAQRWFVLPEGVKTYETQPDGPTELLDLWREANPSS